MATLQQNGQPDNTGQTTVDTTQQQGVSPTGIPLAQKPKNATGFVNLQSYLNAQGSQAGTNIANKLQSNVGQTVQKVQDVNQQLGGTEGNTVANQIASEKDRIAKASQQAGNITAGAQEGASYNPQQGGQNLNVADIGYLTSGAYGQNAQNIQNQAQQLQNQQQQALTTASQKLGQLGTEQGRSSLLQEAYRRPGYSGGLQGLDQAILLGSQGGREALQNAQSDIARQYLAQQQQAANIGQQLQTGLGDIRSQGGLAAKNINDSLTGALGTIDKSLGGKLDEIQKNARDTQEWYKGFTDRFGNQLPGQGDIHITKEDAAKLKSLGMDIDSPLFNAFTDPTSMLNAINTSQAMNATKAGLVDAGTLDKLNTLYNLTPTHTRDYKDTGTFDTKTGGIDTSGWNKALTDATNKFNDLSNKTYIDAHGEAKDITSRDIWGKGKEDVVATSDIHQNVGDILRSLGINNAKTETPSGQFAITQPGYTGSDPIAEPLNSSVHTFTPTTGKGFFDMQALRGGAEALNNYVPGLGTGLAAVLSAGSKNYELKADKIAEAKANANWQAQSQLMNFLKNQGARQNIVVD